MIEFDFFIGTFDEAIAQIKKWIGSNPVNNLIHFNADAGKGNLLIAELESGCFIRTWNYTLKENTRFRIRSATHHNPSPVFMINYLLMPESFLIETDNDWSQKMKKVGEMNNIVFSTNRSEFSFVVKAGKHAKALDICFTSDWLFQQFPAEMSKKIHKALDGDHNNKPILVQTFSLNDYKTVNEVMEKVSVNEWHIIFLKSRVLTLLNELFDNILSEEKRKNDAKGAGGNTSAIIRVEKKLSLILHEKFPNLKEIATEFSLSESTLKRQFKNVYGKGIYEYYLEKKMDLAKRMLEENNTTVSQVAYSLGYEKASPFIKVFKRQFGVSPGSLKSSGHLSSNMNDQE